MGVKTQSVESPIVSQVTNRWVVVRGMPQKSATMGALRDWDLYYWNTVSQIVLLLLWWAKISPVVVEFQGRPPKTDGLPKNLLGLPQKSGQKEPPENEPNAVDVA